MNKVLFVVSEDWYFLSHRIELAKSLIKDGKEVFLVAQAGESSKEIEKEGIKVLPWKLNRSSKNPLVEMLSIITLVRHIKNINPDIVYSVALKPNIYSGIASYFVNTKRQIYAVGGLGYLFQNENKSSLQNIIKFILRSIFSRPKSKLIVQNSFDKEFFLNLSIPERNIFLIEGSGVDTNKFCFKEINEYPCKVLFSGRLLYDKGLKDFVSLAIKFKDRNDIEFIVAGERDPQNPACIEAKVIEEWKKINNIKFLGKVNDMPKLISESHIMCLPSYHEGFPKALLEGASGGRPIIAYDIPGCRSIIHENKNGFLVKFKDESSLYQKLDHLHRNPHLIKEMGLAGRRLVLDRFSDKQINNQIKSILN